MRVIVIAVVVFLLTCAVVVAQEPTATPTLPTTATATATPTVTATQAIPPATPVDVRVVFQSAAPDAAIVVSWSPVAGAADYFLRRGYSEAGGEPTFTQPLDIVPASAVDAAGRVFHVDTTAVARGRYCYRVIAQGPALASQPSTAECITRGEGPAPTPTVSPPTTGAGMVSTGAQTSSHGIACHSSF